MVVMCSLPEQGFKGCRQEKPVVANANTVARQLICLATDLDPLQFSQFSVPKFESVSLRFSKSVSQTTTRLTQLCLSGE